MNQFPAEELLEFPCDHVFKVFGPNDNLFVESVRLAAGTVVAVSFDAIKTRPSSGGAHQCVSVLVRVQNYAQLLSIYEALRKVSNLRYLL